MDYKNIPIFIISHNRLECLKQQLDAFISRGYNNIKIIDNQSRYAPLLEFYKKSGLEVLYMDQNYGHEVFVKAGLFGKYGKDYYALTDCDVVPTQECPDNFMEYFFELLQKHRTAFGKFIYKAGFGLKLDDLPDHYKYKNEVLGWESGFWKQVIEDEVYQAPIDTTFALYRPGIPIVWAEAIRTGAPYLARHTGWYLDLDNLTEDEQYYKNTLETCTHWTKQK